MGMAMCTSGFAGSVRESENDVDHKVIGSRQHAQYDSSRHSVPWNCGMFDTATASCAQPMKLWNLSSMYISTWLGNAENGGAFKMSQFGESWSTTTTMPVCSSFSACTILRRARPVPSCMCRRFGARPVSAQKSKMNLRTTRDSSVHS